MSTADIAVAFLGAEGLVMTGTAAYLGHQLVRRVAAPKQAPGRGNGTSTTAAAGHPGAKTETPGDAATVTPITEEGAKAA